MTRAYFETVFLDFQTPCTRFELVNCYETLGDKKKNFAHHYEVRESSNYSSRKNDWIVESTRTFTIGEYNDSRQHFFHLVTDYCERFGNQLK